MLLLVALSCQNRVEPDSPIVTPEPVPQIDFHPAAEDLVGLEMRLSEAERPTAPRAMESGPEPEVEALTAAEVEALLARAERLEEPEGDRRAFARREETVPPPRTGATELLGWPPPPTDLEAVEVDPGPVKVVRTSPEGDVGLAPSMSVTFNQPMVAVTTQDEAAQTIPVTLSPEPDGQWRWLGTRTIVFDPDPRFPMATDYEVTIPETGDSFSFSTPPVSVTEWYPQQYSQVGLTPVLLVAFDQRVDDGVLSHLTLEGDGAVVPLRKARQEEIAADPYLENRQFEEGRAFLLRPMTPLKAATDYSWVLDKGAPSAEGPRTTTERQVSGFRTYDPLKLESQDCSEGPKHCSPDSPFWLYFNNELDQPLDPSMVSVEPAIEHMQVTASWSTLTIYGETVSDTTYTVTVEAGLPDAFGQRLAKEQTRKFKVGPAWPKLQGPNTAVLALDPAAPPAFSVWSTNYERLRVRVTRVEVSDYEAVSDWMRDVVYDGYLRGMPPGEKVFDGSVEVEDYVENELVETSIDLGPYLEGGKGHLFVWVEPTVREEYPTRVMAWVQATDIGLTAFADQPSVMGWATDLGSGEPLAGVKLSLLGGDSSGETDADGVAVLKGYDSSTGPHALVAELGDDVALLPEYPHWWNEYGGWTHSGPIDSLVWYVIDDRKMYRPGETVYVKGWVRPFVIEPGSALQSFAGAPEEVTWVARDAYGNEMSKGKTDLSEHGGFDLELELPDTPALGYASLELNSSRGSHYHSFQVQEFRRPEFEVTTSLDPQSYVLGESAVVSVNAAYYSGGALPDAPVTWTVSASEGSFQPQGWSDWRFGSWTPWWSWYHWGGSWGQSSVESLEGSTDAAGNHYLQIDFLAVNPARPMTVSAQATVVDVNRQRWSRQETFLVHPSSLYVGVKPDKPFYEKDEPIRAEVIVVDIDGEPVAAEATLTLSRLRWGNLDGAWAEIEEDPVDCTLELKDKADTCVFEPEQGGNHRISATVVDEEGRPNTTSFTVWITGGEQAPDRSVAMEEVTLVPNAEIYAPGDVAEVLVLSPFAPAHGLLTLRRDGLVETRAFSMDSASKVLEVPITEASVPNIVVEVDLVGSRERTDDEGNPMPDRSNRVAYASGMLDLKVPPLSRALSVEPVPAETHLGPGGSTTVTVQVNDSEGKPVEGAEVALIAVDEAVLALSAYQLPDPLEIFYMSRAAGVAETHLRGLVVLGDPNAVVAQPTGSAGESDDFDMLDGIGYAMEEEEIRTSSKIASPPMEPMSAAKPEKKSRSKDKASGHSQASPITVREDFSAIALFAPREQTEADGTATLTLELPDSLTRYRIMAVAADDISFGHGEATVVARKPLMLRPSPPRFLNFGDHVELPLVVQNQTDEDMVVELAVETTNIVISADNRGRRFTVPANDRREVRLPLDADAAGTARFQVVAQSGGMSDAARFTLPVWTPATSEAFATYGEIDEGAILQPVARPDDVWEQFGGLEITTSSTALSALTDAVIYLANYPYDCSEQIGSRVMAVAALRDVLEAFEAEELPSQAELESAVSRDLQRLEKRQKGNGGWSFWSDMSDEPYLTVHVTHSLVRAKEAGYPVSDSTLDAAMGYLRKIESHIPHYYSERARRNIIAYSVYVRHLDGDDDAGRARKLAKVPLSELSLEAQAWILPTLEAKGQTESVALIIRNLENKVSETAGAAHFDTSYGDTNDYVLLHSSRRTDAVVLESLIEVRPEHDLVPKVVRSLLGHRVAGRWSTTQENSFVLLAMNRYFRTYESTEPDFVARAWLGEDYAGSRQFEGYSPDRARIDIPMSELRDDDLVLQKDGEGRLYYRIGMRYAPKDLDLEPADRGFVVTRVYEPIDDEGDVTLDDDGVWHIAAGARVRVRVSMVSEGRRTYVALVDPLPAGLEAQNPELAVTGTLPEDPSAESGNWWWWGTWYQHQNLRDERAEAFTTLLYAGVYDYSYVAVATTPGEFVVPPAKAEEMYHPETFGRSGTDRVVVD